MAPRPCAKRLLVQAELVHDHKIGHAVGCHGLDTDHPFNLLDGGLEGMVTWSRIASAFAP